MVVPFLTDALAALPWLHCPGPTPGSHVTAQKQSTWFCTKSAEFLFTTARGKGRAHSRQQHSHSCSHPTLMGTQEPTPASGTTLLMDQECPAHAWHFPRHRRDVRYQLCLPQLGLCSHQLPHHHPAQARALPGPCSAGTDTEHSQALPSWAPNDGETSGIPFQLFPGQRGRAPSALVFQHSTTSVRERSCHSLVPKPL